jgi:hypothetical protein
VDEAGEVLQLELVGDVVLHDRGRGRGEGDDGRRTQHGQVLAESAVVGAKVMAPLGDAVGFVDGDEAGLSLCEHFGEAGDAHALGSHEEELELAVEIVAASLAGVGAVHAGVDAGDVQAKCG